VVNNADDMERIMTLGNKNSKYVSICSQFWVNLPGFFLCFL
jgi:hypothetical protein